MTGADGDTISGYFFTNAHQKITTYIVGNPDDYTGITSLHLSDLLMI